MCRLEISDITWNMRRGCVDLFSKKLDTNPLGVRSFSFNFGRNGESSTLDGKELGEAHGPGMLIR